MKLCRWIFWVFLLAWGLSLLVLVSGTFGLFGEERDPLAGVFVYLLGLPWSLSLDRFPPATSQIAAAMMPAITVVIIGWLCRKTAD